MDDLFGSVIALILMLAYMAWAVHVGNKVLTGHFAWLDKDAMPSKVCKFLLAVTIGTIIAGFYTFWALFKWMARS